jgi:dGTPase
MHNFPDILNKVKTAYARTMSKYACQDDSAWRLKIEVNDDIRAPFALDRDRILYSGAYRRYHGKTQVFSFSNLIDEEMTNRNLHTTYVSQIARTIGKFLGLNLELIEAISLGHDLGHAPFGHDGEVALSHVCKEYGIGEFHHNIESLHIVDHISRKGKGLNLTFQVRDGIISHDGEVHNQILSPNRNKTEDDIQSYIQNIKNGTPSNWMPATLEGCVVRITDTIAYIGQDIEDAIRLKILKREDLPNDCVAFLGNTNSLIIDNLVKNVIMNSFEKDQVAFDEETSHYLAKLKKFNYEHIYTDANVKHANGVIFRTMKLLFEKYMDDITSKNQKSKIYLHFLNQKNEQYSSSFSNAEKVRDFIATMTDLYYNDEIKDYLVPWKH